MKKFTKDEIENMADEASCEEIPSEATLKQLRKQFGVRLEPKLLKQVAKMACDTEKFEMNEWVCGTKRCMAGWAVKLHPDGPRLEKKLSYALTGALLLGRDAAKHFWDSNDEARRYLLCQLTK